MKPRLLGEGEMKRLLVACEKSRRVAAAFEAKGWEAWSCDILPAEVPGNQWGSL